VRLNRALSAPPASQTLQIPSGQAWKVYYYAGSQRVAMRELTSSSDTLYYLHSDHLGSTSLTTNATGGWVGEMKYLPYGSPRPGYPTGSVPTDRRFTGQRSEEATLGSLYDYGARFYSPVVGRFLSADTIVPGAGNPQAFNRYAYTLNNPVKYTDPTGHRIAQPGGASRLAVQVREMWDEGALVSVSSVEGAENAFFHFLDDPLYFASLLADPDGLWNEEFLRLEKFAGYSKLHTTATDLILGVLDPEVAKALDRVSATRGMGASDDEIFSELVLLGSVGVIRGGAVKLTDGMKMPVNYALDAASEFLGNGYRDMGNGRFVSADGLRQVRMGDGDILGRHGGGPHINFEELRINQQTGRPVITRNIHVYLEDR